MTKSSEMLPLAGFPDYSDEEMLQRARAFRSQIARRRTVRHFSDRPVPRALIDECLQAAGSAPSGANLQPWHFTVVTDPKLKKKIREAAEEQERHFYDHRASDEWLEALAPLGDSGDARGARRGGRGDPLPRTLTAGPVVSEGSPHIEPGHGTTCDHATALPDSKPSRNSVSPFSGVPARKYEPRPVPHRTRAVAVPGRS